MQKVIVVSDTLGKIENLYANLLLEDADIVIHLGDYYSDSRKIRAMMPDKTFYCIGSYAEHRSSPEIEEYMLLRLEALNLLLIHNFVHYRLIKEITSREDIDLILFTDPYRLEQRTIDGVREIGTGSFNGGEETSCYIRLAIDSRSVQCEYAKPLRVMEEAGACSAFAKRYAHQKSYYPILRDFYEYGLSKADLARKYGLCISDVFSIFDLYLRELITIFQTIHSVSYKRRDIEPFVKYAFAPDENFLLRKTKLRRPYSPQYLCHAALERLADIRNRHR
ncbi:hypothetical protein [Candidatus Soleaferrea massiliensis]|uniref:hypothetical protein n=1 Tax=Candidatus Soleaferrea massiliensis TaxID=1470354 RepID=UPI000590F62A|nr:hypothetical protein [Candidatus Soleaferrea massiliensis]